MNSTPTSPRCQSLSEFSSSETSNSGDSGKVRAPGRVNLIGEHIDYHNLPVLPMAIPRAVHFTWTRRTDSVVRLRSHNGYPPGDFALSADIPPAAAGDWTNYIRAAAQACVRRWNVSRGVDAEVDSDLPAAAGLSSSSALLVSAALALLEANEVRATLEELMEVLPEAEHYVGTRGGAMDHAVCLAARRGCACWIEFAPFRIEAVPIPPGWSFVLMHSLIRAEKSAGMREEYNSRRQAGVAALKQLGFASFQQALDSQAPDPQAPDPQALEQAIAARVLRLPDLPQRCFRHVVTEAARVSQAMRLMRERDLERFGDLLTQSHASLRDDLRVSCPELDQVVQYALRSGAVGARLTGAGFGGYAVALVAEEREAAFLEAMAAFYEHLPQRHDFPGYLMKVTASDGALRY